MRKPFRSTMETRRLPGKRSAARQSTEGFVLMEVLVSVAILVVGVTVLLQSILTSLDANRMTQEYTQAIFLAESKMWQLERKYAYDDDEPTGEAYGEFDPPFHAFTWRSEIEGDDKTVEYQIQLTVMWLHRGKELQYALVTVVPMRRAEEDLKA